LDIVRQSEIHQQVSSIMVEREEAAVVVAEVEVVAEAEAGAEDEYSASQVYHNLSTTSSI
jgi:hypothetical protein